MGHAQLMVMAEGQENEQKHMRPPKAYAQHTITSDSFYRPKKVTWLNPKPMGGKIYLLLCGKNMAKGIWIQGGVRNWG